MTSQGSRTILVVEDDKSTRELFGLAFRTAGYEVVEVEDGADALQVLEASIPTAVVLDLDLPRVGGRAVIRDLKGRPDTYSIPIVVVSGGDVTDIAPDACLSVLSKPIHPEALVWAVDKSISRAQRLQGAG